MKISIQFIVQLFIPMTSTDGMMFMMIRHVYVCLQVVGPEDPPIICQRAMADRIKNSGCNIQRSVNGKLGEQTVYLV